MYHENCIVVIICVNQCYTKYTCQNDTVHLCSFVYHIVYHLYQLFKNLSLKSEFLKDYNFYFFTYYFLHIIDTFLHIIDPNIILAFSSQCVSLFFIRGLLKKPWLTNFFFWLPKYCSVRLWSSWKFYFGMEILLNLYYSLRMKVLFFYSTLNNSKYTIALIGYKLY